jgi:GMP synthase-like glutamine amidotransferase
LKIGILETGAPPRELQAIFGRYSGMFQTLLGSAGYTFETFNVRAGAIPEQPESCDAYLITGSAAGVHDGDPWIGQTRDFLRQAKGRAALVGVCFGHQLMADAFGGRVERAPGGWGIGLHRYRVFKRRPWMDEAAEIAAPAPHQDQVTLAPPGATVVAGSDFTPIGMLAYDDQSAISTQLHPEFEPAFAGALIEARRGSLYPQTQAQQALASLSGPDDRRRIGRWIAAFLRPLHDRGHR